jgi:hypothetical protein
LNTGDDIGKTAISIGFQPFCIVFIESRTQDDRAHVERHSFFFQLMIDRSCLAKGNALETFRTESAVETSKGLFFGFLFIEALLHL